MQSDQVRLLRLGELRLLTLQPALGPRHSHAFAGAHPEEVDFENHEGAVLQSGQTTVIWIDDDAPAVVR